MQKALISIEDWSGGITLNKKMGSKKQCFRSFGMDITSRPGFMLPRQAYEVVTGATASKSILDILYTIGDGNTWFAIAEKLFTLATPSTISAAHTSGTVEDIQTLKEYKGYLYYAQTSKVGRYDLVSTYTDSWQSIGGSHHPIEISADTFMYLGAGQYLNRWDGTTYSTNVLDLQMGWDVKCLANFGVTYLAIGANFLSAAGSTQCKVYLWDRIAASWNDEIDIPEQTIYAQIFHRGGLWIFAGTTNLSIYHVPLGSRTPTKVFTFENFLPNLYTPSVAVNAVTVKNGRIFFGYSANIACSDQSIPATYSFNPDPRNFQLQGELETAATETGTDDILISCVRSIPSSTNPTIFVSSVNASNYVLYRQTEDLSNPFGTGKIETFFFEAPAGYKLYFEGFGIDTLKRPAGSIVLEYMKDAETTWTTIFTHTTANSVGNYLKFALECQNIVFRITINSTSGRVPYIMRRFYGTGKLIEDPR